MPWLLCRSTGRLARWLLRPAPTPKRPSFLMRAENQSAVALPVVDQHAGPHGFVSTPGLVGATWVLASCWSQAWLSNALQRGGAADHPYRRCTVGCPTQRKPGRREGHKRSSALIH